MIKSCVTLTMVREKDQKVLWSLTGRKSKVIRSFLTHSIKEKDVLKSDVLNIIWNTMQFQNVWDMWKTRHKQEVEEDESD